MSVNSFDLYQEILSEQNQIKISGLMSLSKTKNVHLDSVLKKDFETFQNSVSYLSEFISEKEVCKRYNPLVEGMIFYKHIPVKTVHDKGILSQNKNVFIYFPCTKEKEGKRGPQFSIELLDTSESIYHQIVFPCIQKTFLNGDELINRYQYKLRERIYLYSYFHELGHAEGVFKILPKKDENLKIKNHHHAIWGEISSDFLVLEKISEIPDLFLLIFFIKIFWYSRINFHADQQQANINHDNDAWEGVFLWDIAGKTGLVEFINDKLFLNLDNLEKYKIEIRNILNQFESNFLVLEAKEQNQLITQIMGKFVEKTEQGHYVLPNNLKKVFQECIEIPEFC